MFLEEILDILEKLENIWAIDAKQHLELLKIITRINQEGKSHE